jgi:hypothetical protein
MASTVFQRFVAADNASEAFAGLKRIHGMMPYFMLKAALKISNPMAMIRGMESLMYWYSLSSFSISQCSHAGSVPCSALWWTQSSAEVSPSTLLTIGP